MYNFMNNRHVLLASILTAGAMLMACGDDKPTPDNTKPSNPTTPEQPTEVRDA